MRHADQIIESDRRGDGSRRKAENQVGRRAICLSVPWQHQATRASAQRSAGKTAEGEALYQKVGNGLYAKGSASADAGMLLR